MTTNIKKKLIADSHVIIKENVPYIYVIIISFD